MKLLIVDDEELTRTGLISSIDWRSIGIDEVLQADDGRNGLEIARKQRPEIILCDVRMPRMTGIAMLEKLEEILPDTIAIFMSGYSDKEYLKAAIKLKAVNYIEKPLNPAEVKETVLEARARYLQKQRSRHGETLHSIETAARLASLLTVPYGSDNAQIDGLAKELSLSLHPGTSFTSYIIKLKDSPKDDLIPREEIPRRFGVFLERFHLQCLYVEKHARYLVYLVFGEAMPSAVAFASIQEYLLQQYAVFSCCMFAQGDTLMGLSKAYQSYASAVILLQSSFFFPNHTFLTGRLLKELSPNGSLPDAPDALYRSALTDRNRVACQELMDTLFSCYFKNATLLQNQAKDLYYRLFLILEETRRQQMIPDSFSQSSIAETIDGCFTFHELHDILLEKNRRFFEDAQKAGETHPTVYLIKEYIGQNYDKETLSVKDISSHVFLSAPYVCTLFKNETGQTLNQYLTEYRMERAKQLLCDQRYKITDISSRVGYSDGNYFGKSFKKYTGYSPSEFREKMMK